MIFDSLVRFFLDDQRFTDLGLVLGGAGSVNVLENATQAQFSFANEATRDFTPQVGSVLLGEGQGFGQDPAPIVNTFDVNNDRLAFDWGDRLDVGPIQSKLFAPDPSFILPIVATVGIQDEPDSSVKVVFP